ncbi:MAG: hypothetical protein ABIC91_00140 [Nanoarchaeota archaeon]|nr:hypothetical protein [Nanoarchaeota archaeon]MBU1029622.1 hypothetical protein [Nanoarchaeota archaeon]
MNYLYLFLKFLIGGGMVIVTSFNNVEICNLRNVCSYDAIESIVLVGV